ncbi:MAG: T9SS type A sorting domain-containing protein [Chitinophagales bacterium]
MIKTFLTTILLLLAINSLKSQNPLLKQWDYSYGGYESDFLNQLLPTPDGGFLACGISTSDAGYDKSADNYDNSAFPTYDCWLIKCNADGIKEWDKTLGGTSDEYFYSIINTADGGFLMAATSRSPVSGDVSDPPIGSFDEWAVKLSSTGTIEWEKRYGGSAGNWAGDVVQLPDGGYLLGGATTSPISGDVSEASYGNSDYWILRIDSSGNKLWDKRYGGSEDESVYKVLIASDGGFLLAGSSFSGISGVKTLDNYVNNKSDMWFVKTDSAGNFEWDKVVGSLDDDLIMDIIKTADHHYIIGAVNYANAGADKTEDSYGVYDLWLMKTDTMLNIIWDHSIGGNGTEDDFGNIFLTAEGNVMISGTSYSDIGFWKSEINNGPENTWIVLLDSAGNKIWDKTILTGYTHTELGMGIQLQDGCYLFANNGDSFTDQEKTDQSYSFDYWCIKYCDTTSGIAEVSAVNFGAAQTEICEKFCTSFTDSSNNNPTAWLWLFPGGSPSTSTSQNPSAICYYTPGTYDVSLITTNPDGNDTLTLPGFITVFATPDLPLISQDGLVLTSTPAFSYQWQLNAVDIPGATNQTYEVLQSGLYTVIVFNESGCQAASSISVIVSGIDHQSMQVLPIVYPNPFQTVFTLSFPDIKTGNYDLQISNVAGQIIQTSREMIPASAFERKFDLSAFPDGTYFVRLITGSGTSLTRIVKGK